MKMNTTLIVFFEPALTLAFIPTIYAPVEFSYNDRRYAQGHGLGTVFLDWLLTTEEELIGLQLNVDILGLNAYGYSTLKKDEQEAQRMAAEKNLSRKYILKSEHFVQLWFGDRRDFNPVLSSHQDMVDCNYVTPEREWAIGMCVDPHDEIIQQLTQVNANWVSNEIRVLREAAT